MNYEAIHTAILVFMAACAALSLRSRRFEWTLFLVLLFLTALFGE